MIERERGSRPKETVPARSEPARVPVVSPINWWKLDATEQAETLMVLRRFVPELVRRYGLSEQIVPRCWYLHEPLIQELLAVFQYRNQQQYLEAAPPSAPLDFHYQFQLAIGRLRFWVSETECNGREHADTRVPAWAEPHSVEEAAWVTDLEEHLSKQYDYEMPTDGDER